MSVVFFNHRSAVSVGRSVTPAANVAAAHFDHHCHDQFELLYLESGSGYCTVEGAEYPLRPHSVILIYPYDYHHVILDGTADYVRYVLNFSEAFAGDLMQMLPLLRKQDRKGILFLPESISEDVGRVFEEMVQAKEMFGEGQKSYRDVMLQALLRRLLLLLSVIAPHSEWREVPLTEKVMNYLNEHLSEEILLDELAQEFFVSKYHLCRLFRERTGVSVITYLNTKRIALAQQLLERGMSAAEVAISTGYRSYTSFYRAYRRYAGHPPRTDVRRKNEETEENIDVP